MEDVNVAEAAVETVAPAPEAAPVPDKLSSVREAARQLSAWRNEKRKEASVGEAKANLDAALAPDGSLPEGEDAAAEEPPSETQEVDAAEELPPITPPRSWSAEDKDTFATLPRETQERLAERERSREVDFNRRTQEAAEKQKALEASMQAAEQTQRQYEAALPILLQNLQQAHGNQFADIQTMADVERMANEDPLRYTQWDAAQKKVYAVQQEMEAAQYRQQETYAKEWQDFAAREDALFAEKVPEIADPAKSGLLREAAIKALNDIGFSNEELGKSWNGEGKISIRDHRFQQLVVDATKYREAKAKTKVAPPKPVPPVVQKPGVSRGHYAAEQDRIKALSNKLDKTGNPRDAAAYYTALRKAR